MIQQKKEQHWIQTNLKQTSTKEQYNFINICPQSLQGKEQCWNTINETLNEIQNGKIILGGDLNLVRNIEEKFGGIYHTNPSRDALDTIMKQHNLMDICPNNGKYTWSKKRVGKNNIKERLDRTLIQENIATS